MTFILALIPIRKNWQKFNEIEKGGILVYWTDKNFAKWKPEGLAALD